MASKTSKTAENRFAQYKANKTWEKNRTARLNRTIKNQPNNEQAKAALKGMVYRRKTPGPNVWSASEKALAKLYKSFTGYFDRAILSKDPKVSQPALQRPSVKTVPKVPEKPTPSYGNSFFALAARLQGIK